MNTGAPLLVAVLVLSACASGAVSAGSVPSGRTSSARGPGSSTGSTPNAASAVPATVATTVTSTTTTSAAPAFSSSESPVTAAQLGATWHAGCPVGPEQLRALSLSFWGFDGQVHRGTIVVDASVAGTVAKVFATLYRARFPLREMVPESSYDGDDNAAAAADDTSGFNCRDAVASGPPQWSVHAYGEAIDVNDVQNPYVDGSTVIPPSGAAYEDRGDVRPGMAVPGGVLVGAFAAVGWQWGGRWSSTPDYQHFSSTGG